MTGMMTEDLVMVPAWRECVPGCGAEVQKAIQTSWHDIQCLL